MSNISLKKKTLTNVCWAKDIFSKGQPLGMEKASETLITWMCFPFS
jgi:hypothetical protein